MRKKMAYESSVDALMFVALAGITAMALYLVVQG